MPNRQMVGGELYRYSFQGQEKDPETGKEAFQLRLWDGRIGRWLTTDPAGQYFSSYMGMGNDPINGIDPDGGYRTWIGAALGWIGNGFSGNIFRSDVATGNHKYGIGLTGDGGSGAGELAGTFMAYSQGDLNSYNFNAANNSWRFDVNGNGYEIDIMKPYESNLAGKAENWTNDYNMKTSIGVIGLKRTGAVVYDAVDGAYVFTTSMIYGGRYGGRHMNGSVASQDDKLFSFIGLAASGGGKIVLKAGNSGLTYMSKDAFRSYLNKNSTFFIRKTQRKVMFNSHNSNITKEIILLKDYNHLIYTKNLFDNTNTFIQE